ncbi:MAG: hypothetical protein LBG64_04600 [Pseudomonadales bacterium]|jgi:Tfp pilus assembly protein PilO|nr:hypothetical protein [Pseudomonadales bacterium]
MAKKKQQSTRLTVDLSQEKTQVTVGAVLFIFVLIILIVFMIRPTVLSITYKHAQIEERSNAVIALNGKINSLNEASVNYAEIASRVSVLNQAIPGDGPELTRTFKIIEKIASDVILSGQLMVITNINVDDIPDVPMAEATPSAAISGAPRRHDLPIRVVVNGEYEAIRSFIQRLKANRHNFQVERLSISAPRAHGGRILDVSIDLNTFYYGP